MEEQKDKYIDKSGDKKYFTQIPNMIVNHSTAYEQSLYLIMKRIAGEGGSCYASINFLADKMGIDKKTVSKIISKLLKREWISEIEKTKVRGGLVRTFVIIDLWPRNIKEYESGSQVPTSGSGCVVPESGSVVPESGRQTDTTNIYNKNTNKNSITTTNVSEKINPLIGLFKSVNPSYKRLFSNNTQRASLERLVKENGLEKIQWTIKILSKTNTMPFSPTITTPSQLEEKLGLLIAFLQKEKLKVESKMPTIGKIQ